MAKTLYKPRMNKGRTGIRRFRRLFGSFLAAQKGTQPVKSVDQQNRHSFIHCPAPPKKISKKISTIVHPPFRIPSTFPANNIRFDNIAEFGKSIIIILYEIYRYIV